ncbi:hypothetical protein NHX12_013871 [Muraenolepis orangiensis]|uniref:Uncharacterized protein n=1 Tax=Muraenolepis orangiensis TaxID=630683 RepID=A0A9Q0DB04_9TELE|nr:hypothetical protein NHX12_013871 [Muraenolepis orangiensis]
MEAAAFDLEGFVDSPSDAGLQSCRKADLLAIAQHYCVAVRKAARKQEVREAVLAGLVEFGVGLSPSALPLLGRCPQPG